MTDARPTIDDVIAAIPAWAGRTVSHERVAGGLTNTNHRVVVDGVPYFVRIPGPSTELLAVEGDVVRLRLLPQSSRSERWNLDFSQVLHRAALRNAPSPFQSSEVHKVYKHMVRGEDRRVRRS